MGSITKKLNKMMDAEQKQIHNEFEKTLKSLDPIFQKNGWIRPRDWTEISNWYNLNFKDESSYQKPKIEDREIYIKWAESNHKNQEIEKPEKGESVAVKYQLLDEFFKGNEKFNNLKIKDQEKLLGFIFGCRADTLKHIKNNIQKRPDGKHITQAGFDRFLELSEKIKKGEIY
jgi:hypothetical protein